jgi:hypothetical protein
LKDFFSSGVKTIILVILYCIPFIFVPITTVLGTNPVNPPLDTPKCGSIYEKKTMVIGTIILPESLLQRELAF